MVEFKTKYNDNFADILALTIADGTPYKATIAFLKEQFDNYNITDEFKAKIQAQMMSNMTIGFTQSAMQTAIALTDKQVMADVTYDNAVKQGTILDKQSTKLQSDIALVDANKDNAVKQGAILDKQSTKLTADTSLVSAQEDAITQQVIDNRDIKVFDGLLESYGVNGAGGLAVSTDMWKYVFDLAAKLTTNAAPAQETFTVERI